VKTKKNLGGKSTKPAISDAGYVGRTFNGLRVLDCTKMRKKNRWRLARTTKMQTTNRHHTVKWKITRMGQKRLAVKNAQRSGNESVTLMTNDLCRNEGSVKWLSARETCWVDSCHGAGVSENRWWSDYSSEADGQLICLYSASSVWPSRRNGWLTC